jgi:hypothetical protein
MRERSKELRKNENSGWKEPFVDYCIIHTGLLAKK